MAVKGTREFDVAATPAAIIDALADIEDLPTWSGPHRAAKVESRYPDGRPDLVRSQVKIVGITDNQVTEYTWDGDKSMGWKLVESSQQAKQVGSYQLTPSAKGTHIVFDLEIALKIPLPGFLQRQILNIAMDTASKDLSKFVQRRAVA
ncbi:SRPBCC family protein [Antrihabitans stalactiti]|uniref:SRPBCC family protein n=1 Tax=Antrihabitans stalactiti TaxID=2584121 RepID=A0A848KM05_9NOCA|nr:SRPBCC family protein [Antrihabitans stalactiti]NMN98886.1 SRPBCC family protein [Antrihabitans stalactiti]